MNKDWIGAYVLPLSGKPDNGNRDKKDTPADNPYGKIVVTLTKVEIKEANVAGRKSEHRIAHFAENSYFDKPMLINQAVNLKRLSRLVGSSDVDNWKDLKIKVTLQAEWSKIPSGGYDWALRIAPTAPEKPVLKSDTPAWDKAITAIESGNTTVDQITKHYKVNSNDLKILNGTKSTNQSV